MEAQFGGSASNFGRELQWAHQFKGLLELRIVPLTKRLTREIDGAVWFDASAFERVAAPGVECHHGNTQNKPMSHFEARPTQDLAGRFSSNNGHQLIFFGKARDRFGGAGGRRLGLARPFRNYVGVFLI